MTTYYQNKPCTLNLLILIVLSSSFIFLSPKGSASMAIITSVTPTPGIPSQSDWKGQLLYVDLPASDIPNPCYNETSILSCLAVIVLKPKKGAGDGENAYLLFDVPDWINVTNIKKDKTLADIRAHVFEKFPPVQNASITLPNDYEFVCMGFGYNNNNKKNEVELFPGEPCHPIPPIDLACKISGEKEIRYNTVLSDKINSYQAQTQLNINCNKDANLSVSLVGLEKNTVRLRPDGSLESSLFINDKEGHLGDVIHVTANQNSPIKISSTLKAKGKVSTGPFHGSATLTMLYN